MKSTISDLHRRYALEEIESLGYFKSIDWVESVDSTNKCLVQLVRQGLIALPALLVADRQTTGVGRGSNHWWSPAGCLMFSMAIPVCQPALIDSQELPEPCVSSELLPLRVGCAVAECLEGFSKTKPLVKWPNDVYISGRKISGVLIEVLPKTALSPSVAIVGIGINCSVDFSAAPVPVQAIATSLHEWTKPGISNSPSKESVLVQFVHQWLSLDQRQRDNPRWLLDLWPEISLLAGQWVEVKHPSGIAQGRCLGINESGALLIQNERLDVMEVLAGTVQSFRKMG